jgi:hypothetical protein
LKYGHAQISTGEVSRNGLLEYEAKRKDEETPKGEMKTVSEREREEEIEGGGEEIKEKK